MNSLERISLLVLGAFVATTILTGATAQTAAIEPGLVEIRDNKLFRDGQPWVAHGFYQIAFEVAPGDLGHALHPFWATAQDHYTPDEYVNMRAAGADSVRLQIAQVGADPRSPLYDKGFFEKAMGAIRAARDAGLTVIVCVQGETHVGKEVPIALPDAGTNRVWSAIAPRFARDRGVVYELFNEPHPRPAPRAWAAWKATFTRAIGVVRGTGAQNVVIADGLGTGQILDGAPLLDDPQIAYAAHPYALAKYGQSRAAWDAKFGKFSLRAPVIITEWVFGAYYCDADTANATSRFLAYLHERKIGLEIGIWDWAPATTGSVRYGFPAPKFSSYVGRTCHQPGYGPGRVIEDLYLRGVVNRTPMGSAMSTPM